MQLNGYIKSVKDVMDYALSYYKLEEKELPKIFKIYNIPYVENQKSTGMCVAFAFSKVLEYFQDAEGDYVDLSPSSIYALGGSGEGMQPRRALQIIKSVGCMEKKDFFELGTKEEVKNSFNEKLKQPEFYNNFIKGKQYRIESYARLNGEDEIKRALLENRPVPIGVNCTTEFMQCKGEVIEYNKDSKHYGGHMIFIIGWDEYGWILQNSWGNDWGSNGFGNLSYNYPILEAWGVFDYKPEVIYPIDIKEHWAENNIKWAIDNKIMNGYADNTFRPDNTVTRAELITVLKRISDLDV